MAAAYELDESEVSFVTGSGKDTNKVQSIVEDAEELKAEEAVEHSGNAFFEAERSSGDGETVTAVSDESGDDTDGSSGQQALTATESDDETMLSPCRMDRQQPTNPTTISPG